MSDKSLEGFHKIHMVGAAGAGMSGLAKLLAGLGYDVTGSDLKPGRVLDALQDIGIETWVGHRPEAMAEPDLVVSSSAVPARDPELRAAVEHGVVVWERPALLDAFTSKMPGIGITGTHGKTTTTGLVVAALHGAGLDPSFLVGGELVAQNTFAHLGDTDLFVLEADEAFGTFRHLHLNGLLVTNIEADHLDFYKTLAALEEAFALVANRTNGPVVGCIDDPGVQRLAQRADVITYGRSQAATWQLHDVVHGIGEISFRLEGRGHTVDVTVPRPGVHIALDAAGAIAFLAELGHDPHKSAAGIAAFGGVRRRFETRARIAGVTVVDDYAHHPTEVGATIDAGRLGGWQRVWAVFQPHRYTRTAALGPAFGEPLASADKVIVTDVYSAGEAPQPGVTGRLVAEAVSAAGGDVRYIPSIRDVAAAIVPELADGDVVLLLGAGDVNSIADEIAATLGGQS
ncbi:MAG: UDP-N-acetylmuramate--L-alanine ligase [Acidimicrobiia bacterium]|nr:UDP-N-acetylmuramate--L-alanine ligase [Acidimicrobiia bacterium]MDX2467005.1 UDP-N-acetylmuramate--L-alanine ligase [Acidimicrobiia bacterium]